MRFGATLVIVGSFIVGGWARATPSVEPDRAVEARRHFENGTRLFASGRLAEALVEFESANRIKPDPALLYDLAETHRALGHDSTALTYYRAFLEAAPYSPKREEVETKIRLLADVVARHEQELRKITADAAERAREADEAKSLAQQLAAVAALESMRAQQAQKRAHEAQEHADQILALHKTPPLYKRWWLWTIVGAVAAAGIATTVVLTRPQVPSTNQGSFAF